jgi:DNA-binding GntR family transcriptional regulator
MIDKNTSSEKRWRQVETRRLEGSISERHLSPALRSFPAHQLQVGQLIGAKAQIYSQLWRSIAEGRLAPGTKLYEGTVRRVFNVSRPLVYSVLQQMSAEGSVTLPFNKTPHITQPSPQRVHDVFEVIEVVMSHVIRELSASSRRISADQRRLLEQHIKAQAEADSAGDSAASHLLELEFMILLAAIHGVASLTDVVARAMVLQTLALKLYGKFPLPPWRADFQREMADAILTHRTQAAMRLFEERHGWLREGLQFNKGSRYERGDLATLLMSALPFTPQD